MASETRQWGIAEFQRRQPVFRVNHLQTAFLGLALWPFGIGLVYWLECTFFKAAINNASVMMWSSMGGGAILAAAACIIAMEWAKATHYNNLRDKHNAISSCVSLLQQAISDEDVVRRWARWCKDKESMLGRLMSEADEMIDGVQVSALDDEVIFMLIDLWVRKSQKVESAVVVDSKITSVARTDAAH